MSIESLFRWSPRASSARTDGPAPEVCGTVAGCQRARIGVSAGEADRGRGTEGTPLSPGRPATTAPCAVDADDRPRVLDRNERDREPRTSSHTALCRASGQGQQGSRCPYRRRTWHRRARICSSLWWRCRRGARPCPIVRACAGPAAAPVPRTPVTRHDHTRRELPTCSSDIGPGRGVTCQRRSGGFRPPGDRSSGVVAVRTHALRHGPCPGGSARHLPGSCRRPLSSQPGAPRNPGSGYQLRIVLGAAPLRRVAASCPCRPVLTPLGPPPARGRPVLGDCHD